MLHLVPALLALLLPLSVGGADESVSTALSARAAQLAAGEEVRVEGDLIAARRLLPEFYRQREFQPVWLSAERRGQLLALVEASRTHGLDPSDYHFDALRKIQAEARIDAERSRQLITARRRRDL